MNNNAKVTKENIRGVWHYTYPKDVEMVVVSGDIHGAFREIVNKVAVQYDIHNALLIVAGDCGFGFEREGYYENIYQRCAKHLKRNNLYVAFVRGNHDNPVYFSEQLIDKNRWLTLPDYSVVSAASKQILCVGGAISVDRQYRKITKAFSSALHYHGHPALKPTCYWPDEPIVYNPELLDVVRDEFQIDTVVTHTAPKFCEMVSHDGLLKLAETDSALLDDVKEERQRASLIYERLKADGHPMKDWIYGHFHRSWHASIDDTMFSMLDCEELKQLY